MDTIIPTHRCKTCGAYWKHLPAHETGFVANTWQLISPSAGKCCDNVPMGVQIEHLVELTHCRDVDGNYIVILGKYGENNVSRDGYIYRFDNFVKALNQRYAKARSLYCEFGFPKKDDWDKRDFARRVTEIREDRICAVITDFNISDDGVVTGMVRPTGPYADEMVKIIEEHGPAFGLRGFCNMVEDGKGVKLVKEITMLVGWDFIDPVVNQPYKF